MTSNPPNMPVLPGDTAGPIGDGTVQGFQPQGYYALPKDDICKALICCGDDEPIPNYTSGGAPRRTYMSVPFGEPPDTPDHILSPEDPDDSCIEHAISSVSQDDANAQAIALMMECLGGVCNDAMEYAISCGDGSFFYYQVPACQYWGYTKAEANDKAEAAIASSATAALVCVTGELESCCKDAAYAGSLSVDPIDASVTPTIVSGSLPPGISMGTLQPDGSIPFTGIPTVGGLYPFVLQVTDGSGNYALKSVTMSILEITTASLPAATIGVPYLTALAAVGGSGSYTWYYGGSLPNGLSFSSAGVISGTPTVGGIFNIDVAVEEA